MLSRDTIPDPNDTRWSETVLPGADTLPRGAAAVRQADLDAAVLAGVISREQAQLLWLRWTAPDAAAAQAASQRRLVAPGPRFTFTNVLYYFGGMVAIGAMTLFMTLSWGAFGPWGLAVLAVLYLAAALKVADHLQSRALPVPAGILATLAVCLVPLVVWCVQYGLDAWPPGRSGNYRDFHRLVDWRWLMLEFATLAAGVVMLWRYRLPFMVMPIAVTLWYLCMDVTHALFQQHGFDWQLSRDMSLVFGLATCAVAAQVDMRTRRATEDDWRQDFAFWLYIFGALMAWGGLSLRSSDSEWGKLGYAVINAGLVLLGAAIGRRVFTVLGALGVAGYLGYLSHRVFQNSLAFPFVLSLLGLGLVALGIWWQRHEAQINARLARWVPAGLQPRD
jgi:hypothetical protein